MCEFPRHVNTLSLRVWRLSLILTSYFLKVGDVFLISNVATERNKIPNTFSPGFLTVDKTRCAFSVSQKKHKHASNSKTRAVWLPPKAAEFSPSQKAFKVYFPILKELFISAPFHYSSSLPFYNLSLPPTSRLCLYNESSNWITIAVTDWETGSSGFKRWIVFFALGCVSVTES